MRSSIPKPFLVFLICWLPACVSVAQEARSYRVLFDNEIAAAKGDYLSDTFAVDRDQQDLPFIGVSAYCLERSLQALLYYRTLSDGRWAEWTPFRLFTEGELIDRTAYEGPPILERIKAIQFKSDRPVGQPIVFRLYFPDTAKKKMTQEGGQVPMAQGGCNCERPAVCGRSCWCPSGNCPPDRTPVSTTPTHLIVHHSAGFNTSSDFRSVVAYYWDLHVNTNGWDDIGYNWLIDPTGVVYEGRGDGRLGAHFSCMNGNTVGICLIGNFQEAPPSSAALARLREWLAWEACGKGIDLLARSNHAPSQLNLRHVSGHRDGNASTAPQSCAVGTACPGNLLYAQLDDMAAQAASFACLNAAPDLVIRELWTDPAGPLVGDTTDLYVSLKNVGAAPAPAIRWDYRIDGRKVGSDTLTLLSPGETQTRSYQNFVFPHEGLFQYCIYADAVASEPNSTNNSYCREVVVSGATATRQNDIVGSFSVYPNPSAGQLTVQATFYRAQGHYHLQLVNALGQVVYERQGPSLDSELHLFLNIDFLPPGQYYLFLRSSLINLGTLVVLGGDH